MAIFNSKLFVYQRLVMSRFIFTHPIVAITKHLTVSLVANCDSKLGLHLII